MKKIYFLAALFLLSFLILPNFIFAQESATVYVSFFYGDGCPHCHKEALFLDQLEKDFTNVKIRRLEVWSDWNNAQLMSQAAQKLNLSNSGVPLTIIGEEAVSGYLNDETTGLRIKNIILKHSTSGCVDLVGEILNQKQDEENKTCETEANPEIVTLPFFGEVDIKRWSLPVLTLVIGAIDGFNPCAMWVLLFLISLLLGMENKKKMWLLGLAFIVVSALVYFLFLAAWLNLFLFLGFISFIRVGIGLVAIGSGVFHLREWRANKNGVCKVADAEKKQKIMAKLRRIAEQEVFWLALAGIIGLAFAVNLIELVCSAGLPAIYTQTLSLAHLTPVTYYLYLLLYIFFFMLDDLLVFFIAMLTLQVSGFSGKYSRWSNLIGGVVIFILGILLIFKPGWIMFG